MRFKKCHPHAAEKSAWKLTCGADDKSTACKLLLQMRMELLRIFPVDFNCIIDNFAMETLWVLNSFFFSFVAFPSFVDVPLGT